MKRAGVDVKQIGKKDAAFGSKKTSILWCLQGWLLLMLLVCAGHLASVDMALCATDVKSEGSDFVQHIMATQEKMASINRRIDRERMLAEQGPLAEQAERNRNVTRLQEIKLVYQRLLNAVKKNISVAGEVAGLKTAMESGEAYALAEQKPYSLSYYDKLLDQVVAFQQEKEVLSTSMATSESKLDEYKAAQERSEQTFRRVKEELTTTTGGLDEESLQYVKAQLEREAAVASVLLQQARMEGFEQESRLIEGKLKAAQQKLTIIRKDLSFDPEALNTEIIRLEAQRDQLSERLQLILDQQKRIDAQWQKDRTKAGSNATESAMAAMEAWRDAYEKVLPQTEEMAHLINNQASLWRSRYALVKGEASSKEMEQWEKEAKAIREQTQQSISLYQNWQVNLQSRISALAKKAERLDAVQEKYVTYRLNALNKMAEFGGEYFSTLLTTGQLAGRLIDEIGARKKQLPLWEKAKAVGSKFEEVWNFELWAIDDNGVTVRKVVTAFVLLVLGLFLLKQLIRLLSSRMRRTKMEAGVVSVVEKLLFYIGLVLIVLFALRMVNIPLTAFTFFGGAIAIGIGFGAQNLINNFISGFIIMVERPIRIGDLIELEGRAARVEEIGARCTRVKTGDNVHILVPNSSFLENNITNWTFSDQKLRVQVAVGVAYGSPVKKVTELLLQAADQTEKVLKEPKPFVIFDDFGDSALVFVIYFWAYVRGVVEKKRISSELRYHINELLNENEIVIAFPQQDVHLDSISPLQVQMVDAGHDGK